MKHPELKRLLSVLLAMVMLLGALSVGVLADEELVGATVAVTAAADDTEEATSEETSTGTASTTKKSLDEVRDILSAYSYTDYIELYADVQGASASDEVVLNAAQAYVAAESSSDTVVGQCGGQDDVLLTPDTGKVVFNVTVPKTAMYSLTLRYYPTGDDTSDIERILYVDGEVPFKEARYITLKKLWVDDYCYDEEGNIIFETDSIGSEVRPSKSLAPEWMTYSLKDSTGYYTDDMNLYLTEGEHTLTLEASRNELAIDTITLGQPNTLKSYDEVYAEWQKKGYTEAPAEAYAHIDAEKPTVTSNNTINATYDRSSAITEPQDPAKIRYNTIGNSSTWTSVGSFVEWKFTVPESGLYKIYTRYRQCVSVDMFTSRCIYIDGEIPFEEAKNIRFDYDDSWQVCALGDGDREFEFYFEGGHEYTIRLEAVLGKMSKLVSDIQATVTPLNEIYLKILQITGATPDEYRDYGFSDLIPTYIEQMKTLEIQINEVYDELVEINGRSGSGLSTLDDLAELLDKMYMDEDEIAPNFSNFKTDIGSLGTWILSATEQPVEIDYFQIQPASAEEPQVEANAFEMLAYELKQFAASFYSSYNNYSADATEKTDDEDVVTIWYTGGRDQAQVFNRLLRDSFTPQTGIQTDMKLIDGGAILPAVLAGTGPDVTELGSADTINWAIRNALIPLDFDDVNEVLERFSDQAAIPFTLYPEPDSFEKGINTEGGGVLYALPVTMSFNLMYYRMDILSELNFEVPETWDELKSMLPVVQSKHMEISAPAYTTLYKLFLYQQDDSYTYWADGGMRLNIDAAENLSCFQDAVEYYTQYAFPLSYDFTNRFRSGEMPVGFADYTQYTYLRVFATEIRGLWDFAEIPGTIREDGTYSNVNTPGFTGVSMLRGAKNPENVWEYMKWWTDEEAQTKYGNELEAILGIGNRYATANKASLAGQSWTTNEYTVISAQLDKLKSTPEYPGSYIIDRYFGFAFNKAYNDGDDPVEQILGYLPYINKEITRKRKEFGLDYLELNDTLEKRTARGEGAKGHYDYDAED